MIETNLVSACCRTEIIIQTKIDRYPLGRNEHNGSGISYQIDACSSCGMEAEPVAVTECCGEEVCTCELDKLEKLRTELAKKAEALGTTHADVIAVSQRIDALHNEINRSMKTG